MSEHKGEFGSAVELDIVGTPFTLSAWLVTAPYFHPWWKHYLISCVRLVEGEGYPPVVRMIEDATHELIVGPLDPDRGPYSAQMRQTGLYRKLLLPLGITHQFEATDEEMVDVTSMAASAVVNGFLNPEPGDSPDKIRMDWLSSVTRTLAHIRGEQHAA